MEGAGRRTAEDDTVEFAHGMGMCAPCRARRGDLREEGRRQGGLTACEGRRRAAGEASARAQPGSGLHALPSAHHLSAPACPSRQQTSSNSASAPHLSSPSSPRRRLPPWSIHAYSSILPSTALLRAGQQCPAASIRPPSATDISC